MPATARHACLLAVLLLTFLVSLGAPGLWEKDEGRYTQAAREMRRGGDLLVPTLRGESRLNKPPLAYWLIAGSQEVFGENEFSARFPSAVAGILVALLVYLLARRFAGEAAGWFAAIAYATAFLGAGMGRLAHPESWLNLSVTASIVCFYLEYHRGFRRKRLLVLAWLAAGLGFLSKGPHGVLLPLLVLAVYLLARRDLRVIGRAMIFRGLLLAILPVVVWGALVYLRLGREVLDEWVHESLGRFAGKEDFHREPPWFFVPVILGGLLPWTLWLPAAFAGFRGPGRTPEGGRFLLVWALTVFLFFSASPNKASSYMLSAVPPVAVAVGVGLARLRPGRLLRTTGAFLGLAGLGSVVTVALLESKGTVFFRTELVVTVGIFAAAMLVVAAFSLLGRARHAAVSACAGTVLALLVGVSVLAPAVSPLRSVREAALAVRETWREGDLLVNFGSKRAGLLWYADLPVHRSTGYEPEDAERLWDGPERIVAFGKQKLRDHLRDELGKQVYSIWSHPGRKYCVFSNRPPAEESPPPRR